MAEDEVVRYERDGALARITLNRPQYSNAQNSAMTYALDDAFYRAGDPDEVKVIILSGAGKHFSAGHDIGTPDATSTRPFRGGPACGGTTSASLVRRTAWLARKRSTSACAGAGANCRSR
jgi:enoyl-CoA hydratase/carnithine racemase